MQSKGTVEELLYGPYVDVVIRERIYLLLAYPKNVQTDLTAEQKKMMRKLIERIKEE